VGAPSTRDTFLYPFDFSQSQSRITLGLIRVLACCTIHSMGGSSTAFVPSPRNCHAFMDEANQQFPKK
jgi:hypothetical protein